MEHIVSLSGGKDSTALLLMMLERGMQVDEAVFFDTGVEYPEMYEHLDKVEQYTGMKVTRLKASESFEDGLLRHERTRGSRVGQKGFGWPTPMARWCTALKTRTIAKHVKGREVTEYVGIAADEAHRCRDKVYPLVEWGVTEAMALEYCKARGFTWGGLYDHVSRLSCYLCPLQSLSSLRVLRHTHPELWDHMVMLDMAINRQVMPQHRFRKDYSLPMLEEKFRQEDRASLVDPVTASKNASDGKAACLFDL